ncbi:uncharacterized protein LOC6580841 [Drosophila mojavensis]|uniref:uncharacterized protein LOC6580841 n=1 Tax=Drosophila mojavensis TaxID=7230 RepID=UPI001CD132CE|nr:uncharacterized protein LOC6580841 [Drosophila mojavensis]
MFDLELNGHAENSSANETLNRVRRTINFVHTWNDSHCYRHDAMTASSREMCEFVRRKASCSYYVETVNLLELYFCTFHLTWDTSVIFLLGIVYLALFYSVYMITKYFCVPNYVTLLELLPISEYTYGYVFIGLYLLLPDYIVFVMNCSYHKNAEATLTFSKMMGDNLRFFVAGIMMLCNRGYHVNGMLWWTNMTIIIIGYIYMTFVVDLKYRAFGAPDLLYSDAAALTFNANTFLSLFLLILSLALLLSYHNQNRRASLSTTEAASVDTEVAQVSSDMDMEKQTPIYEELSAFRIWWSSVNGYANMRERYKVLTILFVPGYFLLANVIPVMSRERPMYGWCKIINIFGFLVAPFLLIKMGTDTTAFLVLWGITWFIAVVVLVAFHPRRQPGHFLICVYSALGTISSNNILFQLSDEINNLTWQYMTMRFEYLGETVCILFFGSGEVLWLIVLLHNLTERNLQDAAFGAVLGVVTHNIYMTLPLLVLHHCYTSDSYFVFTAKLQNCYIFFLVLFFGVLFHVSMSSHELRLSLFFYIVAMTTTFILFEFAAFYKWVHHFGSLTFIKPPRDQIYHWA